MTTNTIMTLDRLLEDIGIDSLDFLDLVMRLEEEFGCDISTNFKVSMSTTIQDVIDYVEHQVEQ